MKYNFLILDTRDNVGVALAPLSTGESITVAHEPALLPIVLQEDIPMGHKFSLAPIRCGDVIKKYGAIIGRSIVDIDIGRHVHLHNIESLRGRGDKA